MNNFFSSGTSEFEVLTAKSRGFTPASRTLRFGAFAIVASMLSSISGCMLLVTPIPHAKGEPSAGLFNRQCSDCSPPWIPYLKYHSMVDDLVTRKTAELSGYKAFKRYREDCPDRYSDDFIAGFIQSHIDLAEGRGPLPPNLPPSRYWTAYYRSCAGKPRVDDWFRGYEVGLAQGQTSGVSQFNRVEVRSAGQRCFTQPCQQNVEDADYSMYPN